MKKSTPPKPILSPMMIQMIATYNEIWMDSRTNAIMWLDSLKDEELPSACIACGACAAVCPQKIDIPFIMSDMDRIIRTIPSWKDICREREKAAAKLK